MSTQTKPDADQRTRFFRLLWIGTLLVGALLRISGLFSSLEYDEIWTLESFAPQPLSVIFTDLALPNNHPLNTLGVKLCIACFDNPCLIRLPALLTGLGSLLLFPVVAFLWTGAGARRWPRPFSSLFPTWRSAMPLRRAVTVYSFSSCCSSAPDCNSPADTAPSVTAICRR